MLCSISGIRLPNTALITFHQLKISKTLFSYWLQFAGPIDFNGNPLTPEEIIDLQGTFDISIGAKIEKNLDEIIRSFYKHMFTVCIEKLLDHEWLPHYEVDNVMLCKIIICASMQYDSVATVIHLSHLFWSCQYFIEDESISEETYDDLSQAVELIQLCYNSISSDESVDAFVAAINLSGKWSYNQNISASLLLQSLLNVQ